MTLLTRRQEFARIERLGDVIVGTDLQSHDAIDGRRRHP